MQLTSPSATSLSDLNAHLSRWLWHLRLREAWLWSLRGLNGGLAIALGLALVARWRPLWTVATLEITTVVILISSLLMTLAIVFLWPRHRLTAARYFDSLFGLAERTSTALELATVPNNTMPTWLIHDQLADAVANARQVQPRQHLPFKVELVDVFLLCLLALSLGVTLYLPNPQQTVLANQIALQQAIAEQAAAVEAIRQEIIHNPNLTPEQKDSLIQPLNEAERKLKEGTATREQAFQVLEEARQKLQSLADPQTMETAAALQQAGESIRQDDPAAELATQLAQGSFSTVATDLANIDPAQMSAEQREALAQQLEQIANRVEAVNSQLAHTLRSAATQLRRGDHPAARQALQDAARQIQEIQQHLSQAQAATTAAARLTKSTNELRQGNNPGGTPTTNHQAGNNSSSVTDQISSAEDSVVPINPGNTNPGGSGKGANDANVQGGEVGPKPLDQNNGPGDGGERTYEEIYAPHRLGGAGNVPVYLPTANAPNGDIIEQTPLSLTNTGEPRVPYREIYVLYRDAAYAAVENGAVPPDFTDIVKQYFTSLEP